MTCLYFFDLLCIGITINDIYIIFCVLRFSGDDNVSPLKNIIWQYSLSNLNHQMMKQFYAIFLGCCSILVSNAGVFGSVEPGMDQDQLTKGLKKNPALYTTMNEAYIARTGLNGVYQTKLPVGIDRFELFFNFNGGTKLRAIDCYAKKAYTEDEFDSMLRSAYKNMVNDLVAQYGKPINHPGWLSPELIPVGGMRYLHDIKLENSNVYISAGIGQRHAGQFLPIFTVSNTKRATAKVAGTPEQNRQDWKEVMEFPHIYQADELMKAADKALKDKKFDYALQIYKQASKLGSARAYWCIAMLYQNKKVKGDASALKKNAEEYNLMAAEWGYAPAAMKYGKTLPEVAKKLGWDAKMCKVWVSRNQRAAAEGHVSSLFNWGFMNKTGFGVPQNMEEAKKYLQLAADKGDSLAKEALKK